MKNQERSCNFRLPAALLPLFTAALFPRLDVKSVNGDHSLTDDLLSGRAEASSCPRAEVDEPGQPEENHTSSCLPR